LGRIQPTRNVRDGNRVAYAIWRLYRYCNQTSARPIIGKNVKQRAQEKGKALQQIQLEKSIIRKRILKERGNQLEGLALTEKEKEARAK
jgi:hypothetical protein